VIKIEFIKKPVPKEEQGRTIERVAKLTGVGKNKIHQIKKLEEEGRQD